MTTIEQSIEVRVPVRTAYDQWTQFASFPAFMGGVERVDQIDDTHTHWVTKVDGVTREFDATITEQHPDERVAWKSDTGPTHAGVVTFHKLSDDATKVMLQLEHAPDGLAEKVGDKLGVVKRQVASDLERFKEFIESRSASSGSWRGDVRA